MFNSHKPVIFTRDCQARLVPSGDAVVIDIGTVATVTQALGSSYTLYIDGSLLRVARKDGDAIGMDPGVDVDINLSSASLIDKIITQLNNCYDPEIPVNIVDLGLVYNIELNPHEQQDSYNIIIWITLTAPACGMGPVLVADIIEQLQLITEVATVAVELVFDPPWDRSMMSSLAQLELGMFN